MPVEGLRLPEKFDIAAMSQLAPIVSATELTALPEDYDDKWVRVVCSYKGAKDDPVGMWQEYTIESADFHNIHPFAFTEKARARHAEMVKDGKAARGVAAFCEKYPYGRISADLAKVQGGGPVTLAGRFVYREKGPPESSLEVWRVEGRLDAETEKLASLVSKPVTFEFTDTPVADVALLLGALGDVRIALGTADDVRIGLTGKSEKQPLGLALRDLLKPAKLKWIYVEPGIRIVNDAPKSEEDKVERILNLLRKP